MQKTKLDLDDGVGQLKLRTAITSHRYFFLGYLLLFTIFATACSHAIPMAMVGPITFQGPPQKISKVIGIYYSPEFRAHEEKIWKKGDRWDFPLGPASVNVFDHAIPRVFEKTLGAQSRPPLSDTPMIDGVIEMRLESFDFQLPWLKTGTYVSEISYRALLYDPAGVPVISWVVGGVGEINGQIGFEFARWPGESADLAVQNAARKFVAEFAKQPDVQIWLQKTSQTK